MRVIQEMHCGAEDKEPQKNNIMEDFNIGLAEEWLSTEIQVSLQQQGRMQF